MTDEVLEVGPTLGQEVMTKDEVIYAFRELKRMKIPLTEVARQVGYKRETLANCILMERFGLKIRQRMTWLLRALLDGRLVAVPAGGSGLGKVFLPSGKALKDHDMVKRLERCVCGQYARCPCLAHKPQYVASKCRPSPSDVAEIPAVENIRARQPSRDARTAAVLGASGSRSHLRLARLLKA